MAGRFVEGIGQLILAVIGFCLVVAWFLSVMFQLYQQFNTEGSPKSVAWLGEKRALCFSRRLGFGPS